MKKLFLLLGCLVMLTACEDEIIESQIVSEDISIDFFSDSPIIYEANDVAFNIENNSVNIESIVVYHNEKILVEQKNSTSINFNFDPEKFPTGPSIIKIEVTEQGGEVTTKDYPITIHRKLFDVTLDDHFFANESQDFFLFASSADGSILAEKAIESTPATFTLTTEVDIEVETPYMVTLASRYVSNIQESANLSSVGGLTRSNFHKFTPNPARRNDIDKQWRLDTSGFSEDLIIRGLNSAPYSYGYDHIDFSFFLSEYGYSNGTNENEDFYIQSYNRDTKDYKHMWLKKSELNDNLVLNALDLTDENQVEGQIDVTYTDNFENGHSRNLRIKGYENQQDFDANIYHTIWYSGHTTLQSPDMFIRPNEEFVLNTSFSKVSHFLHLEDYLTNRTGPPLTQYDIPDWQINFEISNKEISVSNTGTGHTTGKILITSGNFVNELPIIDGKNLLYFWNLNFDSDNTSSIQLPELPSELKNWTFGKFYETNTPKIEWVRLERYEGIVDYSGYLDQIIVENNVPLHVSPLFEAKFKSNNENSFFVFESDTFFH